MPIQSDHIRRLHQAFERARLDDVIAWVDGWAVPLPVEEIPLAQAAGRVLAHDVPAPLDLPALDRAAADGFALRADETVGASAYNSLTFQLGPAAGGVSAGGAAAVASGDPLPAGADAVVRLEHAIPESPAAVAVIAPVFAGSEVEPRGSHIASGGTLLPAASRPLDAADLGLLAAAGLARVPVIRRPRVRLLLAAEKLIEAGQPLTAGEVYNAAGPMLTALVERDGGGIVASHRVRRGAAELRNALSGADIVLVVGGTGPGSNDHTAAALAEAGALAMHGVAIQPGGTAGGGRIDNVAVLLLPGPPVHALWAYELIAGRAIRRMAGRCPGLPYRMETLRIARKIVSEVGTLEVWPVRRIGPGEVEPMPSLQEAGLAAAAHADGFILVPETSEGYPQGAAVAVYLRR